MAPENRTVLVLRTGSSVLYVCPEIGVPSLLSITGSVIYLTIIMCIDLY